MKQVDFGKGYPYMNFLTETLMGLGAATSILAEAPAAADGAAAPMGGLVEMILPLILMFGVFYFLMIRPQQKKDKKAKNMLAALKVGDRICTIGGIYATILGIKDDTIEVSVGKDDVKLVFARWAIKSVEEVAAENEMEVLN